MNLAVRDSEQHRRERLLATEEDGGGAAVEVAARDFELHALRGGDDEGCHALGADERALQIAESADGSAGCTAVGDEDGIRCEKAHELRDFPRPDGGEESVEEAFVILARGRDEATAGGDLLSRALEQ